MVGCDIKSPPLYHSPLPLTPLKCSTCAQSMPLIYLSAVIRRFVWCRSRKALFRDTESESQGQKQFFFKVSLVCAGHIRLFQVTLIFYNAKNAPNRTCSATVLTDCLPACSSCSSFFFFIHCWFMHVNWFNVASFDACWAI